MKNETPKLTIELIPKSSWYFNLNSLVHDEHWDLIRKEAYHMAHYRCTICGGKGKKWPVEAHDIWEYSYKTKHGDPIKYAYKTTFQKDNPDVKFIQRLISVVALCPKCHGVKHFGRTRRLGKKYEKQAKTHLKLVNNWSNRETDKYLDEVFMEWEKRNRYEWELDLEWLKLCSKFFGVNMHDYVREKIILLKM